MFVSALVADVIWARWSIETSHHRPLPAAIAAVGIIIVGVINIDAYITSRWYAVPAAVGAGLGTYFTVLKEKKRG